MTDSPLLWIAILLTLVAFGFVWDWLVKRYLRRLASDEAALRENSVAIPNRPSTNGADALKQ